VYSESPNQFNYTPTRWAAIVDLPELLEAQFGKELATKDRCRDSSGRLEVTMNYSETTVITIDLIL
jgi:hypothetical protein